MITWGYETNNQPEKIYTNMIVQKFIFFKNQATSCSVRKAEQCLGLHCWSNLQILIFCTVRTLWVPPGSWSGSWCSHTANCAQGFCGQTLLTFEKRKEDPLHLLFLSQHQQNYLYQTIVSYTMPTLGTLVVWNSLLDLNHMGWCSKHT